MSGENINSRRQLATDHCQRAQFMFLTLVRACLDAWLLSTKLTKLGRKVLLANARQSVLPKNGQKGRFPSVLLRFMTIGKLPLYRTPLLPFQCRSMKQSPSIWRISICIWNFKVSATVPLTSLSPLTNSLVTISSTLIFRLLLATFTTCLS